MGSDAQTKQLTEEQGTIATFNDEKSAVAWIKSIGDHTNVYIIRNRSGIQVASYCWKGSWWGKVACKNYFGGYKIGPAKDIGGCCHCDRIPSQQPDHPSISYNS